MNFISIVKNVLSKLRVASVSYYQQVAVCSYQTAGCA
jgi:hypothetical protein